METYSEDETKHLLQGISKTTIMYQEWKRKKMKDGQERMRVVDIELPKGEFIQMMIETYRHFAEHIKRVIEQYTSLKNMKDRLPNGHALVQMDFSENYVCQNLEEVQSAYWNATAVTLHPAVIYYKTNSGILMHKSIVFVSEILQHNAAMVIAIVKKIVNSARETLVELKGIHFWTDSPTSQYRNKTVFDLVSRFQEKYAVDATWHYFESGHGKGPCDGIGGRTKRNADNAIKQGKVVIQDAEDFFKWAAHSQSQIEYQKVTEEEFNQSKQEVKVRNENLRPVKGTMKVHSVLGMGDGNIHTKETTCACENCFTESGFNVDTSYVWERHCLKKVADVPNEKLENIETVDEGPAQMQLGDFIIIAYEKKCYIGKIEDIDKKDKEVEVSCMEKCSKAEGRFRRPAKEDRIWVANGNVLKVVDGPNATGKSRREFAVSDETSKFMKEYTFTP